MSHETSEDYLRAISKLAAVGDANGHVRSVDIASAMGLAKSSVSEKLKDLARHGLVTAGKYSSVALTAKGRSSARTLTYKHRIIETFLHTTLGIPAGKVHEEADRLEHAFSDDAIARLDRFLGRPKTDPHGRVIIR